MVRFLAVSVIFLAQSASAQTASEARAAVTRALPILQRSAANFVSQRACVSCHHNSLAVITLHLAQQGGFNVDPKTVDAVEARTFRELRNANAFDDAVQVANLSDPTPNDSYLLMAAGAAGVRADLTTGVLARRIARWQREDGHWITSDFRPPHSSSVFTATATAIRALQIYLPQESFVERETVLRRARAWLTRTPPQSTEDAAFRLMGLAWVGASPEETRAAGRDVFQRQRSDGGWPQLPRYDSDAYSTGEALYALREAGVPASDPAWQKGLKFLVSTQARDGTWRVRTRMISPAEVSPEYFTTGFPYGKDEFLSYAGSCWATMALIAALPEAPGRSTEAQAASSSEVPWARAALFGSVNDLKSLLDAGLDPNSKTGRGSTLLMMAAPDVDKVRLLIARGADVKSRGAAGTDASTIAAAHYGTSASLRALLDAGAEAQPPERGRHSPMQYAAMSGDIESVRLLLARGAESSAEAVSESVTFGHPDVVQALVDAGANVRLTESSGINLLHWATITNRATVVPVLVKAGVPLNATDESGYTPLMYAASVDEGDTATLKALLAAGADRSIRNDEGRTALEQARRYKHTELADALK
ncbi:MAG TPA: ankyrin repeat domain-containing protein [Vicinamibacterales bacterium]|nr:ankyrin repeat domain-containing protein [Vicinamibacterales bacterium]